LLAGERQAGLDEKRRTVHMQRLVDGNRASRRKRYALGADSLLDLDGVSFIVQPDDAEKDDGSVLAAYLLGALRIGAHPLTDSLRRHLLAGDDVALDENAADRDERIPVMGIVVDAQHGPVLQAHARRPLQLDYQSVERVFDPADLEMLA